MSRGGLVVYRDTEKWSFDTLSEFLAAYPSNSGVFFHFYENKNTMLSFEGDTRRINFSVALPNRGDIEEVFEVIERDASKSIVKKEQEPIKVFIGHEHNNQWRDLKDHLHEKQGIIVEAYEIGPRAGLSVKEVLEEMLDESSFACLVLTGEDIATDGEIHAREIVMHEVGLFQGRLGFKKAIILLEEGVHEFSNILGVNQIRFSKGNIKEVYGDVLATIRREFDLIK